MSLHRVLIVLASHPVSFSVIITHIDALHVYKLTNALLFNLDPEQDAKFCVKRVAVVDVIEDEGSNDDSDDDGGHPPTRDSPA